MLAEETCVCAFEKPGLIESKKRCNEFFFREQEVNLDTSQPSVNIEQL